MKQTIHAFIASIAVTFCVPNARGQIAINTSGAYNQNFGSLYTSWTNNSTLLGWYANYTQLGNDYPTTNLSTSVDASNAMNALTNSFGMCAGTYNMALGVSFFNNGATPIVFGNVSYTGEQWSSYTSVGELSFSYEISNSPFSETSPSVTTDWTTVSALTFTDPITLGNEDILDGTQSENQSQLSTNIGITLNPNQYIMFRWRDAANGFSEANTSAVSNVSISYASVPEPSTWTMIAVGATSSLVFRRRRLP